MATTKIYASQDTYISYLNPDNNYYLEDTFNVSVRQVRTATNTASNKSYNVDACALFKYDLNELPQGTSNISSAILSIYGGGSPIQAPAIEICELVTDFNEATVTWNTGKPTFGVQVGILNVFRKTLPTLAQTIENSGDRWQTADITSYVGDLIKTGQSTLKIYLKMNTGYPVITTFKAIMSGAYQSYLTVVST